MQIGRSEKGCREDGGSLMKGSLLVSLSCQLDTVQSYLRESPMGESIMLAYGSILIIFLIAS